MVQVSPKVQMQGYWECGSVRGLGKTQNKIKERPELSTWTNNKAKQIAGYQRAENAWSWLDEQ